MTRSKSKSKTESCWKEGYIYLSGILDVYHVVSISYTILMLPYVLNKVR
jgi:hypothetical protein